MYEQFRDGDRQAALMMAAASDAQQLIGRLQAADAAFGLSFHQGGATPLKIKVSRWTPPHRPHNLSLDLHPFGPNRHLSIDELRARLAAELAELARLCSLQVGSQVYALDFGKCRMSAHNGRLRDLSFARRVRLEEIPSLAEFAAALDGEPRGARR